MTEFLNWKYVSKEQFLQLEETTELAEAKSLLIDIFSLHNLDEERKAILATFNVRNYAFCKEHAFNAEKTSCFLSIMHDIFQRDMNLTTSENSALLSYNRFEEILLKHSVNNSPKSILVFDRRDIEPMIDFVTERYYRNFTVFCHIFGKVSRVFLEQIQRNHIEIPHNHFPSLKSALISK